MKKKYFKIFLKKQLTKLFHRVILIRHFRAGVAQLVEQLICNQQVGGSSPSTSSNKRPALNAGLSYGRIPERPKGADCKSVVSDFGGSNPPSPTNKKRTFVYRQRCVF